MGITKEQRFLNKLLFEAVCEGNLTDAEAALRRGANLKAGMNRNLAGLAWERNDMRMMKLLLGHGAEPYHVVYGAAGDAKKSGDIDQLRRILSACNVNGINRPQLQYALNYALNDAACRNATKVVECLLDHGAEIHSFGEAALENAIYYRRSETLRLLLNRGANPASCPHNLVLRVGSQFMQDMQRFPRRKATYRSILILLLDAGVSLGRSLFQVLEANNLASAAQPSATLMVLPLPGSGVVNDFKALLSIAQLIAEGDTSPHREAAKNLVTAIGNIANHLLPPDPDDTNRDHVQMLRQELAGLHRYITELTCQLELLPHDAHPDILASCLM